MKKSIILYMFLLVSLVACYPDAPEESSITGYAPFAVEGLSDMTVDEEDVSVPLNFTMNENQILDVDVLITVDESSTATLHEDFDLSTEEVSILALGGGGSFSVDIHSDLAAEEDETIVLNVGGGAPLGLPTSQQITITIKNKVLPVGIQLEWNGNFTYAGSTFDNCSGAETDYDVFVFGPGGTDVTGYGGASADCPEIIEDIAQYGDGTYDLYVDYWTNPVAGLGIEGTIPWNLSILKGGATDKVTMVSSDYPAIPVWDYETLGSDTGNPDTFIAVGSLKIAGTTVTLIDLDGVELGSISN